LTRAAELPPTQPWSSGTPVDHLTGIGGLPRGRVALFTGSGTSGKLTLALALLASATRAFAHAVVIDGGGFDAWTLTSFSPEPGALTIVRAPTRRDRARDLLPARSSVGQRSTNPGRRDGNMRVCCGLISHLELARRPDLYGTPVIVGRWDEHVVAASDEAQAFGVLAGMALRQAEHLCPQATFVLPDEEAVVRIRELVSSALYDLAPIVEVRDEGIAWLDLRGVVNPGQSIRAARHRLLKAIGREPRLGLAPGPFSARLAAARARPGRLLRIADAREFLAPLPSRE